MPSTKISTLLLGLMTWAGCANVPQTPIRQPIQKPMHFEHGDFTEVLQKYVDEEGMVDYAALKTDRGRLDAYLIRLAQNDPDRLPELERLAYWINVYNAFTLKLVLENYPVRSILRITPLPIPGKTSAWDLESVTVGGKRFTLTAVEHEIIRKEFKEPRIHFALVCAAMSCPKLRREAYEGIRLDEQLTDQAVVFLAEKHKNDLNPTADTIRLSKIFSWFASDFEQGGQTVQQYLSRFFPYEDLLRTKLEKNAFKIRYTDYNWGLNRKK
ncbi:MAG: DUF547 domain-containing protein [Bacteroidetes Order II. Incertae sedis bacterium]|nr:DUF547 domain-containing protein [Bacteroidetes Order II. bacterium]